MNKQTNMGNTRWFIALTLIASIVGLVVFFTGKNLPDFFASPSETPLSEVTILPVNTEGSDQINQPDPASSIPPATSTITTSDPSPVEPTNTSTFQNDTGWQGEYYNNDKLQEPVAFTRNDATLNFDWKDGNPAPNVAIDYFSVRWTRCLDLEERYYIFTIRIDDYARVLVDDIVVVNANYANQTFEIPFAVTSGHHCIKVEYTELGQSAFVFFDFKAGPTFATVDEANAWKGEYFNNRDFQEPVAFIRNDPMPAFDWKDGNPAPNTGVDYFSVRWTRCLEMEERYYTFTIRSDYYARVLVDDVVVIVANYADQQFDQQFAVTAGRHCIQVEYNETERNAYIYFGFK